MTRIQGIRGSADAAWKATALCLGSAGSRLQVLFVCCETNENPWHADLQFLHPTLGVKTVR